jgi:hypothetical protein
VSPCLTPRRRTGGGGGLLVTDPLKLCDDDVTVVETSTVIPGWNHFAFDGEERGKTQSGHDLKTSEELVEQSMGGRIKCGTSRNQNRICWENM